MAARVIGSGRRRACRSARPCRTSRAGRRRALARAGRPSARVRRPSAGRRRWWRGRVRAPRCAGPNGQAWNRHSARAEDRRVPERIRRASTTSSWPRRAPSTYLRGTASTRLNRSAASSESAYTVDSEQLPSRTVVTPWRTDSRRPGIEQHLGVVVRVDVDEAGDDPLALGVDDVGAARFVERLCGHRGHDAVANAQRAGLRGAPVPSNQSPLRTITS